MNQHWAAKYIGADYLAVGMCWGLVQRCCLERFGESMPNAHDEQSIRQAARSGGWRPVPGPWPLPDDIVVMSGRDGSRHVGFAVHDGSSLGVLHAQGTPSAGGEVVCWDWPEMVMAGYHSFEFWRRRR